MLAASTSVKTLRMRNCKLEDRAVHALSDAMTKNSSLVELSELVLSRIVRGVALPACGVVPAAGWCTCVLASVFCCARLWWMRWVVRAWLRPWRLIPICVVQTIVSARCSLVIQPS
jgi:hypothetical protein